MRRTAPIDLVARQALDEGGPSRVRYMGGEGYGGGSVAEVRETAAGVSVWVDGFRVRSHPTLADFLTRWRVAEDDLRGAP